MRIHRIVSGMLLVLGALTAVASPVSAQRRSRDRAAEVSFFSQLQLQDRARLGVYVDEHQPTRYDEQGARLTGIVRGSPADEAGLEEGDIIASINGQSLTDQLDDADLEADFDADESMPAQRLLALARELEPGDEVEIEYIRDGERLSATFEAEEVDAGERLRLEARARGAAGRAKIVADRARSLVWQVSKTRGWTSHHVNECPSGSTTLGHHRNCLLGAEVIEIGSELGEYFEVEGGILVVESGDDNLFELEGGDVILQIGDRDVSSIRRLQRLLGSYESDETVRLTVMRKGDRVVLEATLEG